MPAWESGHPTAGVYHRLPESRSRIKASRKLPPACTFDGYGVPVVFRPTGWPSWVLAWGGNRGVDSRLRLAVALNATDPSRHCSAVPITLRRWILLQSGPGSRHLYCQTSGPRRRGSESDFRFAFDPPWSPASQVRDSLKTSDCYSRQLQRSYNLLVGTPHLRHWTENV